MCGIGGILGSFSRAQIEALSTSVAHRGPDGHGVWHDDASGIALVHRRLSILDLSEHGAQPMWDADRRVVITYNGEIYNYPELKAELTARGYAFRSTCDTEVIVNGYKEWGRDIVRRLNGIFAFGLWDTQRRELLLARDAFGVKPLYYTTTSRGFAFSSEIKALRNAGLVGRAVDHQAIAAYVTFLYSPGERTALADVKKLLPGHTLVVTAGHPPVSESFFHLPYDQPIERLSVSDAIEQTRTYLRQAVQRQMLSDVPVGAFLSGGLDSSAIVAFAREFNDGQPLECFSIGFRDVPENAEGLPDDLPYAQAVAKHLGVNLNVVTAEPPGVADLEAMVWQLDEPQPDPAALNTYFIARLARERGIKVLLSGAGGDDIFSGYRRHRALLGEPWWSWLPQSGRRMLRSATALTGARSATGRRLKKALMYADCDARDRMIGYFVWPPRGALEQILSPATHAALGGARPEQPLEQLLDSLPPGTPPLNRMLALDTRFFLTDHNLNYTDKMSMAASVETRVPLLDPDVVRFAARLPVDYKQHGAVGKWIFKRAMEGILPHDVIYRRKTGFGAPLRVWMRGGFSSILDAYVSRDVLTARGLFDPAGVAQLIEQDRRGTVDAAYPLFALACIEIWLRKFVDE